MSETNNSSINKSPLRYPGGKTRACKILDTIVNEYFDIKKYDTLISPFFGGGSFEFFIQNKYNLKIIANDKFIPLYNFWNQSKTNNDELCNKLYEIKEINKEQFSAYRNSIGNTISNEINKLLLAYYYFIINRC